MYDSAARVHVAANNDGICWSYACAPHPLMAFRRAASLPPVPASTREAGPPTTPGTLATLAAAQIARGRAGPDQARPGTGTVTFLDRRTLRTTRHQVTVHPFDVPAQPRAAGQLSAGPPLTEYELAERWQRLSDDRFGAFARLDDTQAAQLPLKVTLARLSDPCGLRSAPATVAGASADPKAARARAMRGAVATYASAVVDPRLLVDARGALLGPPEADADELLRSVRAGGVEAFVRATDLSDGQERLLPARLAYPVLQNQAPLQTSCGASAALDGRLALTDGLLQHCARLTVIYPALAARRPSTLAIEDFAHDQEVRYLAAMVRAAALRLTLRDLTGPVDVPVVACATDSGATVYGAGAELADAVKEALTAAVFRYQWQRDPVLQATVQAPASPAVWTAPAKPDVLSPDRLVRSLTSLGYRPCVFALDHDRAVHDAFPHLLQVTLARPAEGVPAG